MMDGDLSRIFLNFLGRLIAAVQACSAVRARQQAEAAR
jgi:hypothetical protein